MEYTLLSLINLYRVRVFTVQHLSDALFESRRDFDVIIKEPNPTMAVSKCSQY